MKNITEVKPYCIAKINVRTGFYLQNQLQYCIQLWGPQHKTDMKLVHVQEKDQTAGTRFLQRNAERTGAVHPGEQKAMGKPSYGLSILKGGLQERLRETF